MSSQSVGARRRIWPRRFFNPFRRADASARAAAPAKPETKKDVRLGDVLRFVWRLWMARPAQFWAMIGFMAIAVVVDSLLPAASGRLVDAVSGEGADPDAAWAALWVFIGLSAVASLMRNASVRVLLPFSSGNMQDLVTNAFRRIQSFSADWHANAFAGATVRKATRGMWALDMFTDVVVIGMFPPLLVIIALSWQLGQRWPLVGLFMMGASVLFIFVSIVMSATYVGPKNQLSNEADSKLGASLADAITCNAVVKAFGAESREEQRLSDVAADWRAKARVAWRRSVDMWTVRILFDLAIQAGLTGFVLFYWARGQATAGDVTFAITAFFILSGYLRAVGEYIQQLQRGFNELEDVVWFDLLEPEVEDAADAAEFRPGAGEIVFDAVQFGYKRQKRDLYTDFSLTVRPGEQVALVGPSGSGKSTFVKLLQRLYDVQGGAIRIDGQDVREATQASLRAAIALVPQDPALFHRSLAENIAYARPDASQEEIEAAAKRARAHEFIADLPDGYETLVGERGVKLSGGERQRIAIARAFLADAPILVLDEATSSLDSATEAEIQEAMDDLVRGRTAILIAHRLSTVRDADRILVFDGGRVVEEGTHRELMAQEDGRYRCLSLIQGAA